MATIPLIQPSNSASRFGARAEKHSIFSAPTVDINDANTEQDLLNEKDLEDNHVSTMFLDPSPIKNGTSVESWTRNNRTLAATFRPSTNEIAVFVAGKKAAEEFPVKQHSTAEDNTVFLCQASIPESRIPFITQMFRVFMNTTNKDPYKAPEIYRRHYIQYYEGIQQYLLQLYEQSNNNMETEATIETTEELELMEGFSSVWQLAEAMFLTTDNNKPIAFMFSGWLSAHDTSFDLDVGKTLLASVGRLSHPEFWPYIHKCLLRGMKESALFIVEQTMKDETDEEIGDALDGFLVVLGGIPSSDSTVPDSRAHERHRKWQEQCQKFAKSKLISPLGAGAKEAMDILTGNIETIFEVTESWEEALAAILLYTNPVCYRAEVSSILNICVSRYLEHTEVSLLDRIKVAILEMDAIKTIRHCGNFHPWLVAHLADVFHQYGYLDISELQLQDTATSGWDSNIRDFFITSYAQSLMSNPNLWEAIAGYLLNCGHTGKAMLSEWICHVPLESSQKAHDVMKFCKENCLADSLRSINRVMAVEEEKIGQYALAIQHFIASKDNDRVAKVADNLMLNYLQSGDLDLDNALASIEDTTGNNYVEFLRSYARFHRDCKDYKFLAAGRTLIGLLSSEKAPEKYWAVMLFDALPLLENRHQLVFDTDDTEVMMRCLEEIVGSQHKSEYLQLLPANVSSAASTVNEREQKLSVVRLSLVRNFARSLAHPPRNSDRDITME